jgi:adenylate kinase
MVNVLMLGAPGSGKGTQGERLAVRHGVPHLSSGDLLRAHVEAGTELGHAAADAMQRGDLIADDLVIAMVLDEVLGPAARRGFVLDGFPRTVAQATAAYDAARYHGVTLQAVVFLDVPHELLFERLAARGAQSGRADDNEATIRHRIDVYMEQTLPLVDYYTGRGIIHRIDATGTIDEVTERVFRAIDDGLRGAGAAPATT